MSNNLPDKPTPVNPDNTSTNGGGKGSDGNPDSTPRETSRTYDEGSTGTGRGGSAV